MQRATHKPFVLVDPNIDAELPYCTGVKESKRRFGRDDFDGHVLILATRTQMGIQLCKALAHGE